MAIVKPFKGIRPPKELVEQVESRPYDVLNSEEARTTMLKAAEEANDLILDLEKLDFMASSGLRIILELAKRMKQKGGNFTVKKPKPVVLDVLEMTGLSSILNITQE